MLRTVSAGPTTTAPLIVGRSVEAETTPVIPSSSMTSETMPLQSPNRRKPSTSPSGGRGVSRSRMRSGAILPVSCLLVKATSLGLATN
jgi:hypothetical protein